MRRALLIQASLLLLACGRNGHPEGQGTQAVPVELAQPRRVQEPERVAVTGTLSSPGGSAMVAFLVPGRAVQVLPREGEAVARGQVLAVLDTTNLAHALEAASAQAAAARAGALRAEDELRRMQQLFDSQSLAPNDFAKFKAGAEAARQQYQQAQAGEAIARRNLEDGTLRAPVAGYVARRMLEPGAMAAPGQPVFEIAALDTLEVNVGVPETDIRLVKVGQDAEVRVPALPGRTFKGLVKVVGIAADPATRTYLTRVAVPNPGRELKVGMVAEVAITGSGRVDLTLVPVEAVVHDAQGATLLFQYFPDQGRVFSRRVEVGAVYGQEVHVKAGLKGDESLVVSGQHALRNGMAAAPANRR